MKKFISLLVVAAFALTLVPVAKADTISDLMAQIAALQAQIAALSGATSTTTCFSANLKLGMRTNDVKLLQEKLGVSNTGYFGPLTLAAVKKFQGDNGVPTTGFVGEMTRAKLNEKFCVVSTTPTTATTLATTATEGSFSLVSAPIATVASVAESDAKDTIMAFGVKAKDSNMVIKKVDVRLTSASALPWKYFTNLYLYQDSNLVATLPVTSSSLIENTFGTDYTARFGNLNVSVAKDATANFAVKADIVATIPASPVSYTVGITTIDAIRGVDSLGLNQTVYDTGTTYNRPITFTTASKGKLSVVVDGNTPVASNVAVSATDATTGITAVTFDLQNTSKYDVTVKTINASVTANASVSAYYLYDGSTMIASVGSTASTATIEFSNLNYVVSANSTKVLTIKFDAIANASSNVQVTKVGVVSAIDNNYNIITATGTADGNQLTLQNTGVIFTFVSATNTATSSTSSVTGYATGTIVFTAKANGLNLVKLSDIANTSIVIKDNANNTISDVTWTVNPDTGLNDGGTATITATMVKKASTGAFVSFKLNSVTFSTTTGAYDVTTNTGFSTFVTPTVWLQ